MDRCCNKPAVTTLRYITISRRVGRGLARCPDMLTKNALAGIGAQHLVGRRLANGICRLQALTSSLQQWRCAAQKYGMLLCRMTRASPPPHATPSPGRLGLAVINMCFAALPTGNNFAHEIWLGTSFLSFSFARSLLVKIEQMLFRDMSTQVTQVFACVCVGASHTCHL